MSQAAASRAGIEQAKGVLMATYGITADGAFDILVWRPQEINIRVREFAQRLLAQWLKACQPILAPESSTSCSESNR